MIYHSLMILTNVDGLKRYSNKIVKVECDSKISLKCREKWENRLAAVNVIRDRNKNHIDMWVACAAIFNFSGQNSHFFKNPNNEDFF